MVYFSEGARLPRGLNAKVKRLSFFFIFVKLSILSLTYRPDKCSSSITENTLFPGLAHPEISNAICFPFAQHYIADSPGCYTIVKDRNDLISKYNELATNERHKTFSATTIVKQLFVGIAVSILIALFLILLL